MLQLAPAMRLSGRNRRQGKPSAPADMFTATRPTGMYRAPRMSVALRRSSARWAYAKAVTTLGRRIQANREALQPASDQEGEVVADGGTDRRDEPQEKQVSVAGGCGDGGRGDEHGLARHGRKNPSITVTANSTRYSQGRRSPA